jgi:hypothetical protein
MSKSMDEDGDDIGSEDSGEWIMMQKSPRVKTSAV